MHLITLDQNLLHELEEHASQPEILTNMVAFGQAFLDEAWDLAFRGSNLPHPATLADGFQAALNLCRFPCKRSAPSDILVDIQLFDPASAFLKLAVNGALIGNEVALAEVQALCSKEKANYHGNTWYFFEKICKPEFVTMAQTFYLWGMGREWDCKTHNKELPLICRVRFVENFTNTFDFRDLYRSDLKAFEAVAYYAAGGFTGMPAAMKIDQQALDDAYPLISKMLEESRDFIRSREKADHPVPEEVFENAELGLPKDSRLVSLIGGMRGLTEFRNYWGPDYWSNPNQLEGLWITLQESIQPPDAGKPLSCSPAPPIGPHAN